MNMNIEPSPATSPLPLQPGGEMRPDLYPPMILLTHIIHPFVEALNRKFSTKGFQNRHDLYYPPTDPLIAWFDVPPWLYEPRRKFNVLDFFLKLYGPNSGAVIRFELRTHPIPESLCWEDGSPRNFYQVVAESDPVTEPALLVAQITKMIEELGALASTGGIFFDREEDRTAGQIPQLSQTQEAETAAA